FRPASASFSTPIICSSVNRFFMTAPLGNGLYIVSVLIAGSRSDSLYTVGICHRAKTPTGVPVRPSRPDIDLHAGAVH
ncbi:hypothetical protein, partial [Ralstonia pseudosolanacearum]|uniref:hypothetical protein n=1 Tax=Ralstonia pseudosolanacearum TaxID=1310165 RepID=UPI0020046F02